MVDSPPEDRRISAALALGQLTRGQVEAALADPHAAPQLSLAERLVARGDLTQAALDALGSAGPPDALGPYEITAPLGAGGMGEVWEVRDPALGRSMAAKVARGGDPRLARRLEREARLTGQLEHPGIPPVHHLAMTEDGRRFFTMKRIEGMDLARVLARLRQTGLGPSLVERLQVFVRICDSVAFAHSRGVIHRDLKPGNVLLGEYGEVLVCDWGLAKYVGGAADDGAAPDGFPDPVLTAAGTVQGTPAYMPPEQAAGQLERVDVRSDVYALGAILYELLTLCVPREGDAQAALAAVLAGPPIPPLERAPEQAIPWELDAAVRRAMASDPADRYPGVAELQADVNAFLTGHALAAARYGWRQRLRRWVRRHRQLALAGALTATVAVTLLGIVGWRVRTERATRLARARRRVAAALDRIPDRLSARLATLGEAPRPPRDAETESERADREAALAALWEARLALAEGLRLAPADADLRRRQRELGAQLGRVALLGGDDTLARHAAGELGPAGAALTQLIETVQTAERRHRQARLQAVLARIERGLATPAPGEPSPLLDDLIAEIAAHRDAATARTVGRALGRLTRARTARRALVWRQPQRDLARFACGVLGRTGQPSEALPPLIAWLDAVVDPELAVLAGRALCRTRDPRAHDALGRALDRFGAESRIWRRILPLLSLVPEPPQPALDDLRGLLRRARIRRDRKDLARALADCDAVLARVPQRPVAHLLRAEILLAAGRADEALAAADRAAAIDPALRNLDRLRAQTLDRLGRLPEARAALDRLLARTPADAQARLQRGRLRYRMGDRRGALADLDRGLAEAPESYEGWLNRSAVRLELGDTPGALADAGTAVRLDPAHAAGHINRANALLRFDRLADARAAYDRALALDPRAATALQNRAVVRRDTGDLPGALADFEAAIRVAPGVARGYHGAADVLVRQGRVQRALAMYDRALTRCPDDLGLHVNRALLLRRLGRHADALTALDRLLARRPDSGVARYNRGSVRLAMGDHAAAREDFQRATASGEREILWKAWAGLASARLALGQRAAARAALRSALEHAPAAAKPRLRRRLSALGD